MPRDPQGLTPDLSTVALIVPPDLYADVREMYSGDPIAWFLRPNPELSGMRPVDMIGTPDEARLRNRIECVKLGMFS